MGHCYVHPGPGCFRQSLVVLAQPSASAQPSQRSFHHPAPGQHFKAMAVLGTWHDFQNPTEARGHPVRQLPPVAAVSPDQLQARKSSQQFTDDQLGSVPVLDVGRVDRHRQQQSHGIYDDMSLPSGDTLARIVAARPLFSVVFTLWLSMMAALGAKSRPSASRTMGRSASWTRSQVPSTDHRRKYLYKVCQGGKSWGAIRQGQPVRSTYRMPLTTSRRFTLCGRPPGLAGGSNGNRISHCSSVRSLGYGLRFMQAVYDQSLYFGNTLLANCAAAFSSRKVRQWPPARPDSYAESGGHGFFLYAVGPVAGRVQATVPRSLIRRPGRRP